MQGWLLALVQQVRQARSAAAPGAGPECYWSLILWSPAGEPAAQAPNDTQQRRKLASQWHPGHSPMEPALEPETTRGSRLASSSAFTMPCTKPQPRLAGKVLHVGRWPQQSSTSQQGCSGQRAEAGCTHAMWSAQNEPPPDSNHLDSLS